jgi:hypothetical protein
MSKIRTRRCALSLSGHGNKKSTFESLCRVHWADLPHNKQLRNSFEIFLYRLMIDFRFVNALATKGSYLRELWEPPHSRLGSSPDSFSTLEKVKK